MPSTRLNFRAHVLIVLVLASTGCSLVIRPDYNNIPCQRRSDGRDPCVELGATCRAAGNGQSFCVISAAPK